MRDTRDHRHSEIGGHLFALFFRIEVDNPLDRGDGVAGVQRGEHQVTGERGGDCGADRGEVAHFSDDDDVGTFAHGAVQGEAEAVGIAVQLPLGDEAFGVVVQIFDRVFQCEDVLAEVGVDVVEHGAHRGGFTVACGADDQDDAARFRTDLGEGVRQMEVGEIQFVSGADWSGDQRRSVAGGKEVDSETCFRSGRVSGVCAAGLKVELFLFRRNHALPESIELLSCDDLFAAWRDFAVAAECRWFPGGKKQIRGVAANSVCEDFCDLHKAPLPKTMAVRRKADLKNLLPDITLIPFYEKTKSGTPSL